MDIPAATPTVTEPVAAIVYDKWIVERLVFDGDGVTSPLTAEAFFKLGRKDENGVWTFHPTVRTNLRIDDVYQLCVDDPDAAGVLNAMVGLLVKLGTTKGVL